MEEDGRGPNVLELFARTSITGPLPSPPSDPVTSGDDTESDGGERGVWLSVGNEAVKFNVLDGLREDEAAGWMRTATP
jgi:hypothetical protein